MSTNTYDYIRFENFLKVTRERAEGSAPEQQLSAKINCLRPHHQQAAPSLPTVCAWNGFDHSLLHEQWEEEEDMSRQYCGTRFASSELYPIASRLSPELKNAESEAASGYSPSQALGRLAVGQEMCGE